MKVFLCLLLISVFSCHGAFKDLGKKSSNGSDKNDHNDDLRAEIYNPVVEPSEFSSEITNPLFNLPAGKTFNFKSYTDEGIEFLNVEVLAETKEIMGVKTAIYKVTEYIDEELVEITHDYLAQHQNGDVWYFGEDVDNYEGGEIEDHNGAWIAGTDGAQPGIWIKAQHQVGDSYRMEFLKGEAEDMRDVLETGVTVTALGQTYADCVKFLDWTPLEPEEREYKFHCPGPGGLVMEVDLEEETRVELINVFQFDRNAAYDPVLDPNDFSTEMVLNPYLNLPVGQTFTYEGVDSDEMIQIAILDETKDISYTNPDGSVVTIPTRVYHDLVYEDGELVEDTRDYLAQHKDGSIWYFGEDVDNYEDGELVDHDGAWIAGKDGAKPGIWLKANHVVGEMYRQEFLLGEAEDVKQTLEVGISVEVDGKTYTDCIKTLDWTPIDPLSLEHKYYCKEAGGLVKETHLVFDEVVVLKL